MRDLVWKVGELVLELGSRVEVELAFHGDTVRRRAESRARQPKRHGAVHRTNLQRRFLAQQSDSVRIRSRSEPGHPRSRADVVANGEPRPLSVPHGFGALPEVDGAPVLEHGAERSAAVEEM